MASAGHATITATSTEIYQDKKGCTSFFVQVLPDSSYPVLVQVLGLHDTGDWFPIPIGGSMVFRRGQQGITLVSAKGDGGSASINYGVVSKIAG
jgi:hypothetical protein